MFVARSGHPLARRAASVQAVLAYPLVVFAEGTIPHHSTESLFSARGLVVPPNALQTLDLMVARALVAQSDAIWITPLGAVHDDLQVGTLERLRIDTPGPEEPVGLLLRTEAEPSAACSAMVGLLRDAARQRKVPKRTGRLSASRTPR